MKRRMLGIVASLMLATFGTLVLVGYVQGAHDRAAAGEPTATVLVVSKPIPRGTKAADLTDLVAEKQVPMTAKAEGAVDDLDALEELVAAADLVPGEQLLAARFVPAAALTRQGVPPGMLEVTIRLDPARAVGGVLRAGDTVAVLASFEPFDMSVEGADPSAPSVKTPNTTKVILHKVLVTRVQTSDAKVIAEAKKAEEAKSDDGTSEQEKAAPKSAPSGEFLVTLALDSTSVERVVFAAEYGTLWLSAQPSDAPEASTQQTRKTIYQ